MLRFLLRDSVSLFYFNKTESDIWLRKFIEKAEKDKRFTVKHILSEPDDTWIGEKGRITKKLCNEISGKSPYVFVSFLTKLISQTS